ncbi:hypothetical protein LMG29542_08397 [Paraburkholderia humisilvae]|uniref:Uncharacterized protein n=1 Tax=Paraburkholderia humisilvae TaxID=627669 RepID=A0A6J5FCR2_9BURK|nr:hypothetical protein LMG29542_08397 [Paraburkholderia humisilvae]
MGRDLSSKPLRALRQHHAEFGEQATHPVVDRGALLDETLPCPMQAQRGLLMFILQRHETHARTGHRFADGCCIGRVILAALARHPVRRHKFWRHQLDRMAVPLEHPCPVMRARTGFHTDETGRQLGDQRNQLVP